jgi:osmotically-inducible protein OsmY
MLSDNDIRQDVEAELKWCPDVDATNIAIKVNGGAVTLTGFARDYFEKRGAEIAARRIKGVAAVANDIELRPLGDDAPTDPEIARAAVAALKLELPISWENIKPVVRQGRISLEGEVEWHYQRQRAESAGVISVRHSLRIKPSVVPGNIHHDIERAFKRLAHMDADRISVNALGAAVTLRGEVRSWAERDQALQTAWSAPGVTNVINELTVRT